MWIAAAAFAEAPEGLQAGEMYGHSAGWTGNAYTTPKGMVSLHPLIRSSFGVADQVDVKASMLGLIGGPHADIEVAPVLSDSFAVSIEAGAGTGWGFGILRYRAIGHVSARTDSGMFNVSVGYHGVQDIDPDDILILIDDTPNLRVEVGYDFLIGDYSAVVLTGRTNVLGFDTWGPHGALGAYYNYAKSGVGVSAGLNVALLGTAPLAVDDLPDDFNVPSIPATIPIPLPHLQIWFRI